MQTVLIVIHLMVVLALVGVVLLQRSEGGGLGIGGGSGFMTARGAANALTRTTGILALAFFITSLSLSLLARYGDRPIDILNQVPSQTRPQPGTPNTGNNGILDQLGGGTTTPAAPAQSGQVPAENAPAETAPAAPSPSEQPGASTPMMPQTEAPAPSTPSMAPAVPVTPQVPTGQ